MPSNITSEWLHTTWTEQLNLWFVVGYLIPGKEGMHQESYQRIDHAAARLLYWDSQHLNTFYAVSIFKEQGNRKQTNVAYVGMLFGDVDIYPKSSYRTQHEAIIAICNACSRINVPQPTLVLSGRGVHFYLVFQIFISLAVWKPIATGFKLALIKAGLELDPARTADASSVLRAPGTHNWKDPKNPLEVRWDGKSQVHPLDDFLRFSSVVRSPQTQKSLSRNPFGLSSGSSVQKALAYDAPTPDVVAAHCGQLAQFKINGDEIEPLWHAHAGAMARMRNGYELFHKWSANGYPDYDQERTQKKIEYAHAHTTGPTTCQRYHSLRPAVCETCPLWGKITTPLQAPSNGPGPDEADSGDSPGHSASDTFNGYSALPDMTGTGMEWEKDGSLRIALDLNSKSKKTLHDLIVSKFPFYINSINRLETAGDGGGLHTEFNHLLPTGEWGSISIANSKLYSPTGNQTLSGYGLLTNDWQNFRKAVVHMTHQIKEEGVQYSHWGWKDDHKSFLIGNRLYTNGAIKVVPVNATMLKRGRGLKPATGGSLGAWQRDANKMFGPGLEPMGIVLMASFAAPLMSLAWREGGVLIYLVAESAKGKTLALEMGASVWGEYDSLRLISDDTRISKSILMGTVCHLPVLHDELTQGEPKYFEQWMKTFSEGKDKARATGDGTVHETDFHWSTNLIGAGNQSCKDLLSDQGDTADAMGWRIVELLFDTEKRYGMMEMEAIRDRMVANAGWAGDDYLRYLVTPGVVESVKARMREKVETLITKYGFEQKHRFYLRFLSCLWSAGEIIEKLELLEIDTNRQVDWVAQKMVEQIRPPKLKEPSIYDVAIDSTATKILIDFLNENNEYKLIVKSSKEGLSQGMPIMEPRGKAVYVRHEMADKIMYLYDKWFAKWLISKRYSVQSVLKELIKLGVMDPLKKAKNLGAGTVWDFNGRVDCYVVRLVKFSKLTEEDEAGKIIPLERIKRK